MHYAIQVKNLYKEFQSYGETFQVFKNLSFDIKISSSTALIGDSGSGKTTLINILAGLESPSSGNVSLIGTELWKLNESERSRFRLLNIAVIFQQYNLVPSLNVSNNIALQARLVGNWDKTFQDEIVELLDLENLLPKYPEQISGGQQQRVAIARAMLTKPKLLLGDEPTGNLDEKNALKVTEGFKKLITRYGTTVIVATHSKILASKLTSKLIMQSSKADNRISS